MRVDMKRRIDTTLRDAVTALAEAATEHDGIAHLSEQTLLNLDRTDPEIAHFVVTGEEGQLLGYAQLDERPGGDPAAELLVSPAARRRGIGRNLLTALTTGRPDLRLWSHGELPAATALAAAYRMEPVRILLKMGRPLHPEDTFPVVLPAGYSLSTYRPEDAQDWVELNAAAFADHAEQGRMTVQDVQERERTAWFDPAGFFLVRGRDGRLDAFHWTKVENGTGEVYVVAVAPDRQGLGLGSAVTAIGLEHLRRIGCPLVELYVDGHNQAAIRTYQKLGFEVTARHVQYASR